MLWNARTFGLPVPQTTGVSTGGKDTANVTEFLPQYDSGKPHIFIQGELISRSISGSALKSQPA